MAEIKSWYKIVIPHEDIRKGRFDESIFAASLGKVVTGRGALEYRDPELFFKKTFLTKGISSLIQDISLRIAGSKGAEPVVQLQTPFGGGKTHTLLSIYHLFKNSDVAMKNKDIKSILEKVNITNIPKTNVAVIDGDAINASEVRKTAEGLTIQTIWGEIAYQLGGAEIYKLVADSDKKRMAPGSNAISDILEKTVNNLILIDELLIYVKASSAQKVGEGSYKGQVLAFLQQLSVAVANHPTSLLLVTLPSSHQEHMDEEGEEVFQKLLKIFGRVETVKEPVEGEEIYEIVRKRLFDSIGSENEIKNIVDSYWNYYQEHKDDLPKIVSEPPYKKLLERAYPFHPETINILREKWGTIENFQRTRGVLRLLALITSDLYTRRHPGHMIQPSHINLANSQISGELLKFIGRQYEGVIASDISGSTAKSPVIDRELGSEYAKESLAEGLATSIFMHSFSGKSNTGASEPSLRLSLLNPEITFSIFSEALNRLVQRLWYVDTSNNLYRFSGQPNLNKILIEKEEAITKKEIIDFAQDQIWKMVDNSFQKKYRFPEEDRDIADSPIMSLIILGLERTKGNETWPDTKEFIQKLLNNHGNTHRKFKNSLIFLVPDELNQKQLVKIVRRYIALKLIFGGYNSKELSKEQKDQLEDRLDHATKDVPQIVATTYRHVIVGGEKNYLQHYDMGAIAYVPSKPISNLVIDTLKENEKILDKIDPSLLIGNKWSIWPTDKSAINVKELWEYFAQYTNLPILTNDSVLKSSIAQGVGRGIFGFGIGDGTKFETVHFMNNLQEDQIEILESSWLLQPELARKLVPQSPQPSQSPQPPIIHEGGKKLQRTTKFSITVELDWQNWSHFFDEVISPLLEENADIKLELKLNATSSEGIKLDTIDLKILESLTQRNIRWSKNED